MMWLCTCVGAAWKCVACAIVVGMSAQGTLIGDTRVVRLRDCDCWCIHLRHNGAAPHRHAPQAVRVTACAGLQRSQLASCRQPRPSGVQSAAPCAPPRCCCSGQHRSSSCRAIHLIPCPAAYHVQAAVGSAVRQHVRGGSRGRGGTAAAARPWRGALTDVVSAHPCTPLIGRESVSSAVHTAGSHAAVQVLVRVLVAGVNGGCETFRARGEHSFAVNQAAPQVRGHSRDRWRGLAVQPGRWRRGHLTVARGASGRARCASPAACGRAFHWARRALAWWWPRGRAWGQSWRRGGAWRSTAARRSLSTCACAPPSPRWCALPHRRRPAPPQPHRTRPCAAGRSAHPPAHLPAVAPPPPQVPEGVGCAEAAALVLSGVTSCAALEVTRRPPARTAPHAAQEGLLTRTPHHAPRTPRPAHGPARPPRTLPLPAARLRTCVGALWRWPHCPSGHGARAARGGGGRHGGRGRHGSLGAAAGAGRGGDDGGRGGRAAGRPQGAAGCGARCGRRAAAGGGREGRVGGGLWEERRAPLRHFRAANVPGKQLLSLLQGVRPMRGQHGSEGCQRRLARRRSPRCAMRCAACTPAACTWSTTAWAAACAPSCWRRWHRAAGCCRWGPAEARTRPLQGPWLQRLALCCRGRDGGCAAFHGCRSAAAGAMAAVPGSWCGSWCGQLVDTRPYAQPPSRPALSRSSGGLHLRVPPRGARPGRRRRGGGRARAGRAG
jgi:hypothetical protein